MKLSTRRTLYGLALAAGSALLLTLAFPPYNLGGLVWIGFVPLLPVSVGAFWLRGALMNMGHPLYTAFMMERTAQEERGTVNSIVQMSWQVGWMVGPVISGAVQARVGFSPLFLATGTFYALSAGLLYYFFRDAESELPSEAETEIMA